jgi:hypothetical protein
MTAFRAAFEGADREFKAAQDAEEDAHSRTSGDSLAPILNSSFAILLMWFVTPLF